MKRTPRAAPLVSRASKRATTLIEMMLKAMQRGMAEPEFLVSEEWAMLFGSKQSMVVNLQKLVQALAALPGEVAQPERESAKAAAQPLSAEEMALLTAWLADGGAS